MRVNRQRAAWCILALALLTTACTRGVIIEENATFSANVLEVDKQYILVKPLEGEQELNSSDRIRVSLRDGDSGVFEEISVGDTVEITYDGVIAESYPAQINGALGIKVTESTKEQHT